MASKKRNDAMAPALPLAPAAAVTAMGALAAREVDSLGRVARGEIPPQTREANFLPATFDEAARTVELIWSTGARVPRLDWWTGKRYDEELSLDAAHVDLSRLNAGAPLLVDHRMYEVDAVHGVVERAWIVDGQEGRAIVRFSADEEAQRIAAKVREGVVRNVSITYAVRKYEVVEEDGKVPLYRAVDWMPMEISFVPVGADAGAGTRAAERTTACEFVHRATAHNQEDTMSKTNGGAAAPAAPENANRAPETPAAPAAATPAAQPDADAIARAAVEAERRRAAEIRARVRSVGLTDEFAENLVSRGVDLAHVGDAIVNELAARGGTPHRPRITSGVDHTDPAEIRAAMVEALVARATASLPQGQRIEMSERGRSYAQHSVLEMFADLARAHGVKVEARLSRAALYDQVVSMRALSTSDFPILLADAGNKILVKAYELANPTYRRIMARKTFNDFKAHKFIRSGDFPNLLEVGESGEYQYGSMGEAKQELTLATYGRIMGISRRILINDDLAAFADLPMKVGRRIADFENGVAFALFTLNTNDGPTITETGRALWNTTDKTKASSGAAIDVTTLGAGRAAMMKQTSIDGQKLNVAPAILLTGPDYFTLAEQFVSVNLAAAQSSNVNPFAGKLTPLADANISGNQWFLFADPAQLEVFVYGYLAGAEGPRLFTREGFTTDGVELKVSLDFVAGAIDFRGSYKNAGA